MVLKTFDDHLNISGSTVAAVTTLEQSDNGVYFVRSISGNGNNVVEQRVTVGSDDGQDMLAGLTSEEVSAEVQKSLDLVRQNVQTALTRHAAMQSAIGSLN